MNNSRGYDWSTTKYSIAICPHCPPSVARRRIDEVCDRTRRRNGGTNAVISAPTEVCTKFECRKDTDGKDHRIISPCNVHSALEWAARKRHGQAKRKEMLDEILAEEKLLIGSVPARLQTISNSSKNVIEKLENGIVVNEYRRYSTFSVDWVNHPTRILSGPNAGWDSLNPEWQQAASGWSQKQVRERDQRHEKGWEAASKDEDLDPPPAYEP